jgi:P-type E1-E2 ATPase
LGKWGYTVGFLVFVSCMTFYFFKCLFNGDDSIMDTETLTKLLDNFTIALAVIIVAVPEGLPLSISIAMAFSVDILKKEHLLVKELDALENMGSITEICTGKTATLTTNKMSVACYYTAD